MFAKEFNGGIGIDLGTTYSCVAVMNSDGRVDVIANEQGNRTTPSYVSFSSGRNVLVGDAAKNQAAMNPCNTIFDAKRLIGRRFDEESVQKDMALLPYQIVEVNDAPHIKITTDESEKIYSPVEISSKVLLKMKEIAEMKLGETVTKAVITVPAYFNDAQRQATKDAGEAAGLQVLRIINEPTAAALAYGLIERQASTDKTKDGLNVLIFDLGGGTFDVSILNITGGVFSVKATAGDTHLGGEDFDQELVKYFVADFKKRKGSHLEIEKDHRALRRLRTASERAKRSLSTSTNASVDIEALFENHDYEAKITRAKFEELNSKAFERTIEPVRRVMEDAKMKPEDIDQVVLVGGSTRIPRIQVLLADLLKRPLESLNKSINPDEAVAYGAAVQAALLCGTAQSTTADMLLLDVVPLSLGVELEGGQMGVVVPRNTGIPVSMYKDFTTVYDAQTTVEFPIYEGERPVCSGNNLLGKFSLNGVPACPRGVPVLRTVFDIDANGILKVTATETTTGLTADVVVEKKLKGCKKADVEQALADAEENREQDQIDFKRAEARSNYLEYLAIAEKQLRDMAIAGTLRGTEDHVDAFEKARSWIEEEGATARGEVIESRFRQFERSVNNIISSIYAKNSNRRKGHARG